MSCLRASLPDPVYVFIRNDKVEIRDARPYWGMSTYEAQWAIRSDLNNHNYKIAVIGPAGENQVTYASIHSQHRRLRFAHRRRRGHGLQELQGHRGARHQGRRRC